MPSQRPVVLCIFDGWGIGAATADNSIKNARTPCFDALWRNWPHGQLETSGLSVGLPEGQMGNSEVGHMTMGAGRVIYQDLPRISREIEKGVFEDQALLQDFVEQLKKKGRPCHLMGIFSDGGVHGHMDHLIAAARFFSQKGVKVYVHGFLDGRDTSPQSAKGFLEKIESVFLSCKGPHPEVMSLSGRYYAMDRDKRWERLKLAFNAIVQGKATRCFSSPLDFLKKSYEEGVFDEFVIPGVRSGYQGMAPEDGVFMVNFRADRVVQLLSSLADPNFSSFDRDGFIHRGPRLGMVSYVASLDPFFPALFTSFEVKKTLGELVSHQKMRQLRLAETEKYAHVTYFFNGGREEPFEGEDRYLVPSPKVASYDLSPEMSARELTEKLCEAIEIGGYDLIVVNYANADMVGHTGNFEASCQAVECLDQCLSEIIESLQKKKGVLLLTADHGNAECLKDPATGGSHTAHTLNPVPILLVGLQERVSLRNGTLADVAPTLGEVLGLDKVPEMSGSSLIVLQGENVP